MWFVNSIFWDSITLSNSWAELVTRWILDCINLSSAVIRANVRFRKSIFSSGLIAVLSGFDSRWSLSNLFSVEVPCYIKVESCGLHGDMVTCELIRIYFSTWTWESFSESCRTSCPRHHIVRHVETQRENISYFIWYLR